MNALLKSTFEPLTTARVLHVIASASPVRGGTSTAIWMILDALRRHGVDAELATTDDDGPQNRLNVALDRFVEQRGFKIRYFPRQTRLYGTSLSFASWLAQAATAYDLVHVHGVFGFVPVAATKIAHARGVPYVVSPHGMLERWGRENVRSWAKKASIHFLEGPSLRRAAAVHFTSESEWQQARELAIPMNPAVFPLALDDSQSVSSKNQVARETNTLLFLSRIDVKKGLDLLIEAFAQLAIERPALRLIIAGNGAPELIADLKALAERAGVAKKIEWAGFVQGLEKSRLLARSTLFVLPSRSENFGYAVAEAMAAGLPVVITKAVGICDLVRRVGAGRVADVSTESICTELARTLDDPQRERMGMAGHEAIRDELSMDEFGSRLIKLYASILQSSPKAQ